MKQKKRSESTPPEWLTTEELAAWLNVPIDTVRRWRYTGTGPRGTKIGRHVRYRRSDVETWLATRPTEGGPAAGDSVVAAPYGATGR